MSAFVSMTVLVTRTFSIFNSSSVFTSPSVKRIQVTTFNKKSDVNVRFGLP